MKPKIAVILLAVFLCLTMGCSNTSHIAEQPAPVSSSESNKAPDQSETAQAEKKTEVDRPQSTESQTDSRAAEFPASVSESDTQTTEVPDQADHSTAVLPQPSEPEKKTDESERRPETAAPTEKEQPTPPATEESTPPEPPKEEPTEPVFDISYWISFAKSYDERSRTYGVSSNNKAFQSGMGGYSIFGSCLDGTDPCVRLDGYMFGENAWKIEKCYMMEPSREMLDIICGKFFITYAPFEAERFQSLPPELAEKFREKFKYPERFMRVNNEIVAVPFKPVRADKER